MGFQGETSEDRSRWGRIGGISSWIKTEDRAARAAHMQRNSPSGRRWHAIRLGFDPDNLTADQEKRAEAARKLYFIRLGEKAKRAKRARKRGSAA